MSPLGIAPRVSLISLGCPRTLVDSEMYLGRLTRAGCTIEESAERSDVVVINTCSFIQESVQESIDTILEAVELKKRGTVKAVIVAGCLVQRFQQGLIKELPDVDGFVGIDGFGDIEAVVERVLKGERPARIQRRPRSLPSGRVDRVPLTRAHYAYLKVSEGCLKGCSFCIIPKIKGPLVSRPMEELIDEARGLVEERGVKELIVVGQDTSDYGVDRDGRPRLVDLLHRLARIKGVRWIRVLYFHPRGIRQELVEALRDLPAMCKYLDMAIEHADDGVLAGMNRQITQEELRRHITTLRTHVPGIALRTSVIVGFPGETDEAFATLLQFIREMRFERLGAFQYSNEEGSAAFRKPDQVPPRARQARFEQLMAVQQDLAQAINREWLGRTCEILIDEADPTDPNVFLGRTQADCPEVDGLVYVRSPQRLQPGTFVQATISDTYEYDLVATVHPPEGSDLSGQRSAQRDLIPTPGR